MGVNLAGHLILLHCLKGLLLSNGHKIRHGHCWGKHLKAGAANCLGAKGLSLTRAPTYILLSYSSLGKAKEHGDSEHDLRSTVHQGVLSMVVLALLLATMLTNHLALSKVSGLATFKSRT